MKPPLVTPNPRAVSLKRSTPTNILTAYMEELWHNAAVLARQRYRVTQDPYYLAIEIAAKSQSDTVADRNAGKLFVESLVKDNVTIPDVDALDLYELACSRTDINYPATIGTLRARLVKASPKDQKSCIRCFDACVWNFDWKNAQQIATSLHKNFANERKFLFRYILATHQLSLSDDCPEGSRKIFSALARAQADKAFDSRLVPTENGYDIDPAALTESEASLCLQMRMTHYSLEENLEHFRKPQYSPLTFLNVGQREPYRTVLQYLKHHEAWDDVFRVGKAVIEQAIRIGLSEAETIEKDEDVIKLRGELAKLEAEQSTAATESAKSSVKKKLAEAVDKARPPRSLKDYSYLSLSCEHGLFAAILDAARYEPDSKKALKQVRSMIEKLIKTKTRAGTMRPVFQRTYDIFSLAIFVERGSLVCPTPTGFSQRAIHITNHAFLHCDEPSSFREILKYMKWLTQPEVFSFIAFLRTKGVQCTDTARRLMVTSLSLRLRYVVATRGVSVIEGNRCGFCNAEMEPDGCLPCLKLIVSIALETYRSGIEIAGPDQDKLSGCSQNPLSDIAETGAYCLLRLAGLGRWSRAPFEGTTPLYHVNIQMFLQAVIWLDSTLTKTLPASDTLRLLLVKLYLLMGCASRAKTLWDQFDVKNSLLDSLGMLYIDRLSSIAPGLFLSGSSRDNPVDPFMVHFTRGLKSTTPKKIMDSLEEGTYSGVHEMIRHAQKQAASCTLAMAVVEERRGLRMKAGKVDITPIEDYSLVRKLSIEHDLNDTTNYGLLTSELSESQTITRPIPLHEMVNYGPLPTGTRAHLGLLAEHFLDFVCYVQPKEYKPSRAGLVIQLDWEYASATSGRLEEQMRTLLGIANMNQPPETEEIEPSRQHAAQASLTTSENQYHKVIWRLAHVVKDTIALGILSASTNDSRDQIRLLIKGVLETLEGQTKDFLDVPESPHSKMHAFHGFAAMHAMGMLREALVATKHTVHYLMMATEKAKNLDKVRNAAELAWLTPELKKMWSAAVESENTVKARIKLLRTYLDNVDSWRDGLCNWVFGQYAPIRDKDEKKDEEFKKKICEKVDAIIPKANAELWADKVGESWRELMKGWIAVRFD